MNFQTIDVPLHGRERPFHWRPGTSDEKVMAQVFQEQDYDLARLTRCADLVKHSETLQAAGLRPLIVDAGANIGASAIYFLHQQPRAHLVAIEPETTNFELMTLNLAGLDVDLRRAALAGTAGRRRVVDRGKGHWAYGTEPVSSDTEGLVEAITVNDIYRQAAPNLFPQMVKLDIEGGEADVFSGDTTWVSRTPLIIIELHDWMLPRRGTSAAFLRCIAAHDRDFVHYGENIYSISNDLNAMAHVELNSL